jgi:hypothetical protein
MEASGDSQAREANQSNAIPDPGVDPDSEGHPPRCYPEHSENQSKPSKWERLHQRLKKVGFHDWVMLAATVVIAISTTFYTIYARDQLRTMRSTLDEVVRSGNSSTNQMWQAVGNLNWEARSMEATAKSERAFLWVTDIKVEGTPLRSTNGDVQICVSVVVMNGGRSPAVGVRLNRFATFGPNAINTIRKLKVTPEMVPRGDIIGPSGGTTSTNMWGSACTKPVDARTAVEILNNRIPIYAYGAIQYFDIFGDYHETGFCSYRMPTGPFKTCEQGIGNWWFDRRQFAIPPSETTSEQQHH